MQDIKERAKVAQYYWAKVEEFGSRKEAAKFIQRKVNNGWDTYGEIESDYPIFDDLIECRIKPETVTHPGGEYPKPCTVEEAEAADVVYASDWNVRDGKFVLWITEHCAKSTKKALAEAGMAYLKIEQAVERGKVIYQLED